MAKPTQSELFPRLPTDRRVAGERSADDRYREPSLLDAIANAPPRYKIEAGGKTRNYTTLAEAQKVADAIHKQTGVFVGIDLIR